MPGRAKLLRCPCCSFEGPKVAFDGRPMQLTALEEHAVSMIFQGLGPQAMARELGVRLNAMKMRLFRIYGKLGVRDSMDLIAKAHREGGFWLWVWDGKFTEQKKRYSCAADRRRAEVLMGMAINSSRSSAASSDQSSGGPRTSRAFADANSTRSFPGAGGRRSSAPSRDPHRSRAGA